MFDTKTIKINDKINPNDFYIAVYVVETGQVLCLCDDTNNAKILVEGLTALSDEFEYNEDSG